MVRIARIHARHGLNAPAGSSGYENKTMSSPAVEAAAKPRSAKRTVTLVVTLLIGAAVFAHVREVVAGRESVAWISPSQFGFSRREIVTHTHGRTHAIVVGHSTRLGVFEIRDYSSR